MNDGVYYEKGNGRSLRAVVERYGIRMVSEWRKTKEAALRNLVVNMAARIESLEDSAREGEYYYFSPPENLRLEIADGIEALAMAEFKNIGDSAELFHVNGKEHIVMKLDRMFRGSHTLRWVHRREVRVNE